MSDIDFEDILNSSVEDIVEPTVIPMGTWRFAIIKGQFKKNTYDNGPIADALFTLVPVEAMDDVAEVELEGYADQMEGDRVFHKISVWEARDKWTVRKFLTELGVEFEKGDTLGESIANSKGYELTAYVTHAENEKNPDKPYVNLSDVKKAE